MNKRDKLNQLRETLKVKNSAMDILSEEQVLIESEADLLLYNIIEDEGLLNNTKWEFSSTSGGDLTYLGSPEDPPMKEIYSLFTRSGSSYVSLEEGISLIFGDTYVSLYVDNMQLVLLFIKKHKIIIDGTNVVDRLREIKREASILEKICHQFGF